MREKLYAPFVPKPYQKQDIRVPSPAKRLTRDFTRFFAIDMPKEMNHEKCHNPKKLMQKKISSKRPTNKQTSLEWIAKEQNQIETCAEIMSCEIFRIMLGERAPKYRFTKNKMGLVVTLSRRLQTFQTFDAFTPKIPLKEYKDKRIQKTVQNLFKNDSAEGFLYLVVVCILLGKYDLHSGNYGVIYKDERYFAATVDHGCALNNTHNRHFSTIHFMMNSQTIRKELLVTKQFIKTCQEVIEHFNLHETAIDAALEQGAETYQTLYGWSIDVSIYKKCLSDNLIILSGLCAHIACELAILENEPIKLKEAASQLPSNKFIFPFGIFSFQNFDSPTASYPSGVPLSSMISNNKIEKVEEFNRDDNDNKPLDKDQKLLMEALEEASCSIRPCV